jgi:hypothetical protein
MYSESRKLWEKSFVIYFKLRPSICLERPRKTMKNVRVIGVPAEILTGFIGNAAEKQCGGFLRPTSHKIFGIATLYAGPK